MIVNGKQIAEDIYEELQKARRPFGAPRLGILVAAQPGAVIESFVRIKSRAAERLGVEILRIDMPELADTGAFTDAVRRLETHVDGIIVQLPLPPQIDTDAVLAAIPQTHDVDGINPTIAENDRFIHAPVATAVEEILKRSAIDPHDKRAVVVGAGRLVGAPVAALLRAQGADVSVITLEQGSLDALKDADIIVLGAGNPGIVKPEMIKEGVVLIDAGTSESAGKVMGDADPQCAEKSSLFTPVPGGVGPVAVAMIFRNLFTLLQYK